MHRFVLRIGYLTLTAAVVFGFGAGRADAFSCSPTGVSGGNPGGLTIYSCTGIHEGDTLTFSINQTFGPDHVVGNVTINVFDIANGQVLLDIDLTNSSNPGGTANRLTEFGLGIDPDATGGSISDIGGLGDVDALTTYSMSNSAGFQLLEFCATANNNCSGGGSGGVQSGQEDLFRFTLNGTYTDNGTISLSQFAFKFQGGQTSYELPGTPDRPTPPNQVPAPAALALLASGLATLTARRYLRGRSS